MNKMKERRVMMTNKTNILGIGKAVYLDGTQIRVSKPDDWGWFYDSLKVSKEKSKDNGDKGGIDDDRVFFVIKVIKIFRSWKVIIIDKSDNVESIEVVDDDEYRPDKRNGLLYSFHVRINTETDIFLEDSSRVSIRSYKRSKNADNAQLISESGYYPSLFFFMLGNTSCGKTCWNYALNTAKVMTDVKRRYDNKDREVKYDVDKRPPRTGKFQPTKHSDVKFDTCINLCKKDNDEIKARAFVVDIAGEVANIQNNEQTQKQLRDSIRRYAAGVFVIRNTEWLFRELDNCNSDPERLISKLRQFDISKDKFCYILTSADKIKKAIEEDPKKGCTFSLTPDSPIFYPAGEQEYENWAITSYIMKERGEDIENSPCFTISSGCEDGDDFYCDKGYNAELPLVYMLKSLVKID